MSAGKSNTQKKYRAFNLRCNDKKRQNIVDFMSLSKNGPVEVTKTNEELNKIDYIDFKQREFYEFRTLENEWKYATLRNTYKITNGEA